MAEQYTGADAVRFFMTGGDYDAQYQSDASASLGNYRSSVVVHSMAYWRYNPIPGIRIEFISGNNGEGVGSLFAVSENELRWAPPGATVGDPVTILQYQTKVLTGDDDNLFIIVTRTTADSLTGNEAITLLDIYNNVVGGSDFTSDEASAGESKYRGLMAHNGSALTITGLTVWLDSTCASHVTIAKETPTANALQDMATELIQPSGLTWTSPTTEGTGVVLGDLTAGSLVGLRIEQVYAASTPAAGHVLTILHYSFTYDSVKYTGSLRGLHRIANDSLERYETHQGIDAEVDLSAAPAVVSASSPWTLALSAGHTHHLKTVRRSKYDIVGPADEGVVIVVGADGRQEGVSPSQPSITTLSPGFEGLAYVRSTYDAAADGVNRATEFLVYYKNDGTLIDPDVDVPTVYPMVGATRYLTNPSDFMNYMPEYLDEELAAADDGTPQYVLVRTRRTDVTTKIITSITRTGGTATVTATAHGFITGDDVTIAGVEPSDYNGLKSITVTGDDTFTFAVAGTPTTPATGNMTASRSVVADSTNTATATCTANWSGPRKPVGLLTFGRYAGQQLAPEAFGSDVVTWINQGANIYWLQKPGQLQLWANTVLCFNIKYSSVGGELNGIYTPFGVDTLEISGAGTGAVEYIAGPPILIYLNVAGVRRLKIDVTNTRIYASAIEMVTIPPHSSRTEPAWAQYQRLLLQVWDPAVQQYTSVVSVENDGVLRSRVQWRQQATQADCL